MPKVSEFTAATPVLTDQTYLIDDPGGVPVSAKATLQAIMDLFEANFAAPASALASGTLADARVAASNVSQHEAVLSIAFSQIPSGDKLGNGTKVPTANVAGAVGDLVGYGANGVMEPVPSANLADPGADRILFWDSSGGGFDFLTAGSGLDLIGTTLTATIRSEPDIAGSDQVVNVVSLTTAEYTGGTKDAATLYLITDAT